MIFPWLALPLSGRQVVVRGAAPDWPSGQAARCRMAATQRQPFGPGLFARRPASSLGRVRTYTPSFFPGLRANRSRRGLREDHKQALDDSARFHRGRERQTTGVCPRRSSELLSPWSKAEAQCLIGVVVTPEVVAGAVVVVVVVVVVVFVFAAVLRNGARDSKSCW